MNYIVQMYGKVVTGKKTTVITYEQTEVQKRRAEEDRANIWQKNGEMLRQEKKNRVQRAMDY